MHNLFRYAIHLKEADNMRDIVNIGTVDYVSLLSYIGENNLSEGDVIHLNNEDYQTLIINSNLVSEPCFIKGVYIKTSDMNKGYIQVIKCTLSSRQSVEEEIYSPFPVIYRCGWCGNIVAEDGSLIDIRTRNKAIEMIRKFGDEIRIVAVSGDCCPNENEDIKQTDLEIDTEEFQRIVQKIYKQNIANPNSNVKEDIYNISIQRFKDLQDKPLSEIDNDDLIFLGFERVIDKDFMFLYNYNDFNNIKKYFNKENDKFEMRGFRLQKEKDINSVRELIDNSLVFWKLKMDIEKI